MIHLMRYLDHSLWHKNLIRHPCLLPVRHTIRIRQSQMNCPNVDKFQELLAVQLVLLVAFALEDVTCLPYSLFTNEKKENLLFFFIELKIHFTISFFDGSIIDALESISRLRRTQIPAASLSSMTTQTLTGELSWKIKNLYLSTEIYSFSMISSQFAVFECQGLLKFEICHNAGVSILKIYWFIRNTRYKNRWNGW